MDILLLTLGFACVITGFFGSFLPVLPGPSISWIGLALLYFTNAIDTNFWILGISLLTTITVVILDYLIPSQGIKKFGGTYYGIWGTNIGLVVGLLTPIPFSFLIGPFIGTFIGELLFDPNNYHRALKAATGSILGFIVSSFMKFIICIMYLGLFLWIVYQNKNNLF
jgi:uncharacterized protein YqgC (DUF456 family)